MLNLEILSTLESCSSWNKSQNSKLWNHVRNSWTQCSRCSAWAEANVSTPPNSKLQSSGAVHPPSHKHTCVYLTCKYIHIQYSKDIERGCLKDHWQNTAWILDQKLRNIIFGPQAVLIGLFISKTGIEIKFWIVFSQNLNKQNFGGKT